MGQKTLGLLPRCEKCFAYEEQSVSPEPEPAPRTEGRGAFKHIDNHFNFFFFGGGEALTSLIQLKSRWLNDMDYIL